MPPSRLHTPHGSLDSLSPAVARLPLTALLYRNCLITHSVPELTSHSLTLYPMPAVRKAAPLLSQWLPLPRYCRHARQLLTCPLALPMPPSRLHTPHGSLDSLSPAVARLPLTALLYRNCLITHSVPELTSHSLTLYPMPAVRKAAPLLSQWLPLPR